MPRERGGPRLRAGALLCPPVEDRGAEIVERDAPAVAVRDDDERVGRWLSGARVDRRQQPRGVLVPGDDRDTAPAQGAVGPQLLERGGKAPQTHGIGDLGHVLRERARRCAGSQVGEVALDGSDRRVEVPPGGPRWQRLGRVDAQRPPRPVEVRPVIVVRSAAPRREDGGGACENQEGVGRGTWLTRSPSAG